MEKKIGSKFKEGIKLGVVLCISTASGAGVGILIKHVYGAIKRQIDEKQYGNAYDFYLKSNNGVPIKMPISNDTVAVVFDETFDENAKKICKSAIEKFDVAIGNIDVNLYSIKDNSNYQVKISLVDNLDNIGPSVSGVTKFLYNELTATIALPITIEVEKQYVDQYWWNDATTSAKDKKIDCKISNNNNNYSLVTEIEEKSVANIKKQNDVDASIDNSVLSTIIQHECGHCLGLRDLYEGEYAKKSVMYFAVGNDTQKTYTDLDLHNIQYIYDKNYKVNVSTPKNMEISYCQQKKYNEEETM